MQEKNKNENTGDIQKQKPHKARRHGYFMEPPTGEKKDLAVQATSEQNQNARRNQNRTQSPNKNQNQNQGKNHAQRDNNGANNTHNQNKPHEKRNEEKQKATGAPAEDKSSQNTQPSDTPNEQKKKRNRNRHKSKSGAQNAPKETVQKQPAQEQKNTAKKTSAPENSSGRTSSKNIKLPTDHSADDYEEYKLFVQDEQDTNAESNQSKEDEDANAPKTEVVGIRFKSSGKIYYFDPHGLTLKRGSGAIVDTARGQEFGEVAMTNTMVKTSDIVPPLRTVIRCATPEDAEHHKENKKKEDEAFKICNERIADHKLNMKLIDAQYTFDNSKLLFYFTSNNRVDFRDLVKDLASVFRTRIELRQIGIRDEAKIMGGLGMCGRPLCCTLFLSDFDQVSIKMAKEQNLSLNSAKISGICGRLMCCLKYEHEAYEYEIKRTPPVDSLVRTENGDGIVTEISPLQGTVKVRLLSSPDVIPKTYKRDDITMLRKKQTGDKK